MEEEFILVFYTTEKEILVMASVQNILLNSIESQVVGFGIRGQFEIFF